MQFGHILGAGLYWAVCKAAMARTFGFRKEGARQSWKCWCFFSREVRRSWKDSPGLEPRRMTMLPLLASCKSAENSLDTCAATQL